MTPEEIKQAEELINTPITAENVDLPIEAVFPQQPLSTQREIETPCSNSPDDKHCQHWYDNPEMPCCYCHEGARGLIAMMSRCGRGKGEIEP